MLVPMIPVLASWDVIIARNARRTLLLYNPKLGSSPEARKTMSPRPTGPGPSSYPPPVHSPLSFCLAARYCRPRSYISRTSRGTTSPNLVPGGCAPTRGAKSQNNPTIVTPIASLSETAQTILLVQRFRCDFLVIISRTLSVSVCLH